MFFDDFTCKKRIEDYLSHMKEVPISSFQFSNYNTDQSKLDEALLEIVEVCKNLFAHASRHKSSAGLLREYVNKQKTTMPGIILNTTKGNIIIQFSFGPYIIVIN